VTTELVGRTLAGRVYDTTAMEAGTDGTASTIFVLFAACETSALDVIKQEVTSVLIDSGVVAAEDILNVKVSCGSITVEVLLRTAQAAAAVADAVKAGTVAVSVDNTAVTAVAMDDTTTAAAATADAERKVVTTHAWLGMANKVKNGKKGKKGKEGKGKPGEGQVDQGGLFALNREAAAAAKAAKDAKKAPKPGKQSTAQIRRVAGVKGKLGTTGLQIFAVVAILAGAVAILAVHLRQEYRQYAQLESQTSDDSVNPGSVVLINHWL
jgi:hypothetical protein